MRNFQSALVALAFTAVGATAALAQKPTRAARAGQLAGRHAKHPDIVGAERGLFRGMTLTDAEKERLKAVRQKYAPDLRATRQSFRPDTQALRAARQNRDTAALKALRQRKPLETQQIQALRTRLNADLRSALTPENQAKFDANLANIRQRLAKRSGRQASRSSNVAGRRVRSFGRGPAMTPPGPR